MSTRIRRFPGMSISMIDLRKMPPSARIALVAIALLNVIAAGIWCAYYDTYHFAVVRDGVLYRDGVRSPREFATAYRKSQFKTVVNLVSDAEFSRDEFQNEVALCREKGVDLIRIPIKEGGQPSDRDVEQFLKIAQDQSKWPVLVHCAQGIQRTGMMVASYQKRVLGYDKQKAIDSVLGFGKGKERTDAVKGFIESAYSNRGSETASAPSVAE